MDRKIVFVCALALAGCFNEKPFGETTLGGNTGSTPNDPPSSAVNQAPRISGSPMTTLRVGDAYDFRPNASDPDGDTLSFTIENRPAWADFNRSTGRLSGTPNAGNVGEFSNVRITVSDGRGAHATLNPFAIAVTQIALGTVTLSWTPPTTNVDGSPMTDLAGYRIYYGRSATTLDQIVRVTNAGMTRFVVENLSPATWYFSMTSVNSAGVESTLSTVVSTNLT